MGIQERDARKALLLLGFPMMIPLIIGAFIGVVSLFGDIGKTEFMVQQMLGGIRPASLIAVAPKLSLVSSFKTAMFGIDTSGLDGAASDLDSPDLDPLSVALILSAACSGGDDGAAPFDRFSKRSARTTLI